MTTFLCNTRLSFAALGVVVTTHTKQASKTITLKASDVARQSGRRSSWSHGQQVSPHSAGRTAGCCGKREREQGQGQHSLDKQPGLTRPAECLFAVQQPWGANRLASPSYPPLKHLTLSQGSPTPLQKGSYKKSPGSTQHPFQQAQKTFTSHPSALSVP